MTRDQHSHRAFVFTLVVVFVLMLLFVAMQQGHGQATAHYRPALNGAVLNDRTVTPGDVLLRATKETLCASTFHTGTVRDVLKSTKYRVCALYGIPRAKCVGATYEIDHLISLELGGSNDIKNLWPEPYLPLPGARDKDVVEDSLHRRVCAGQISLAAAQDCISHDWTQCTN